MAGAPRLVPNPLGGSDAWLYYLNGQCELSAGRRFSFGLGYLAPSLGIARWEMQLGEGLQFGDSTSDTDAERHRVGAAAVAGLRGGLQPHRRIDLWLGVSGSLTEIYRAASIELGINLRW